MLTMPSTKFEGWIWRIERRGTAVESWPQDEDGYTPLIDMTNSTYTLHVEERSYSIPSGEAEVLIRMSRAGQHDEIQAWIDGFLTGKGVNV